MILRREPAPSLQEHNQQNIEYQNLSINDSTNELYPILEKQKSQNIEFKNNDSINEELPILTKQKSQNIPNSSKNKEKVNIDSIKIRNDLFKLFIEI